jgi:hypothetical protein
LIEHGNVGTEFEEFGTRLSTLPQENFVNGVYLSMDKAVACELDRLRDKEGVHASCKLGCFHCCRCNILTNIAEAQTLAQYVRREFSAGQIRALRLRTQQWHEWDNSRPGRYPAANSGGQTDLSGYDHCCPLVEDGACGAYSVRPGVCRTHFVSSPPLSCSAANDPKSAEAGPAILRSVVEEASPFTLAMREYVENQGLDFTRSIMLLPQWLAIEMEWDFAISP